MLDEFKKELNKSNEIYLKVKVKPGSGNNEITEIMADETIKIDIAAKPVKNQANQELIKFLASEFKVSKDGVKIISGAKERVKLIKIKS